MRVLLWMNHPAPLVGGHRSQLSLTAEYLRRLGVEAEARFEVAPALEGYDLVHGFGVSISDARRCRQAGIPLVLSTIYWERWYLSGDYRGVPVGRRLKIRARMGAVLMRAALAGRHLEKCDDMVRRYADARVLYEMADMLLPNSDGEAAAVRRDLGVTTPMHVVPNGVEPDRFTGLSVPFDQRKTVLCVARFEPHKNQLGLVRALAGTGISLVLAGAVHTDHAGYADRCRQEGRGAVRIVLNPSDADLVALYQAAKVHVLPSWYETTGLVSLEAALSGCNVVTTDRGFARDYFSDLVWYCDPAEPASVRRAVLAAFAAPWQDQLAQRVRDRFTWNHAARATAGAYAIVLQRQQIGMG